MLSTPANTLPKEERLCGKTTISALISGGRWGSTAHLKYCWRSTGEEGAGRIMVSVSKRYFKRAVKRNLLKRRLREAYRTQKSLLPSSAGVDLLLSYSSAEILSSVEIRECVAAVLRQVADRSAAAASNPVPGHGEE